MSADHPLIRMLAAFDARVREMTAALADASHEFELPEAIADPGVAAHAHGLRATAARSLWFTQPVPLTAFLEPGNRIAILAPDLLRQVLVARTLFSCRDAVRRCVDRRVRAALADSIGATALAALSAAPITVGAADHTLPADLSAEGLARVGWQLLTAVGACSEPSLCNLVELSLAAASDDAQAGESAPTHTGGGEHRPADVASWSGNETQRFFSAAGGIFPELQWLFG